jgi:hypothetical protein
LRPVGLRIEVGQRFTAWLVPRDVRIQRLALGESPSKQWDHLRQRWMVPKAHVPLLERAMRRHRVAVEIVQVDS